MTKDLKKAVPQADREDDLSTYRTHLQSAEQKSQEDFDKTVLSLSGGALGISFVFLKDVIGPQPIVSSEMLLGAWIFWGASTFCVLFSYYLSHLALRKTIRQIDANTIRDERPGGGFSIATAILNAGGAILFLIGVILITLFAHANFKSKGVSNASVQTITTTAPSTSTQLAPSTAEREKK